MWGAVDFEIKSRLPIGDFWRGLSAFLLQLEALLKALSSIFLATRAYTMEHVHLTVRNYFATLHWRGRVLTLALIVGLLCGIVAVLYEMVMDFVLEIVWREGGELFKEKFAFLPPWTYILIVCTLFGPLVGLLIRVCGEPMANLPGVVLAAHKDGLLGHEEAPAMAAISIASIVGAGSLGPEAPLVSIGGGLASLVSIFVDLTEAETLFVTMCGMGAGLAAFFGEPVGGALFACEVIHRYGLEYYEAVIPTVVAGLACNWSFRVIADLPQKPIWTFAPEEPLLPWTSILGLLYGALGGLLGWAWMRGTNLIRAHILVPYKLGPKHILKGLIGGALIGLIGVFFPETLFWAEYEAQTIISKGATVLPHVNPAVGILGAYSLENPIVLFAIGIFKLLAISFTVLAGYRGGFIFPFMFAGHSIGTGLSLVFPEPGRRRSRLRVRDQCRRHAHRPGDANRPVVPLRPRRLLPNLARLLARCPLHYRRRVDHQGGARPLSSLELDGAAELHDNDAPLTRRRTRVRTPGSTPGNSLHDSSNFSPSMFRKLETPTTAQATAPAPSAAKKTMV